MSGAPARDTVAATAGLLATLRARCAAVASDAQHVRLDEGKAAAYAGFILGKYKVITTHDEHHFVSDNAALTAAYNFALGAVNFGSGYFRTAGIEYRDIAGGLMRAFGRGEMTTPEEWRGVTAERIRALLFPDAPSAGEEAARARLATLFARHLSETGRMIIERHGGRVEGVLEAAGGSAARLVEILSGWETYRDVAVYKGMEVPFLKRAQLLAAHLDLAGTPKFPDIGALTCFADNMVPHVLRCDGVLTYSDALADRIDGGALIQPGSAEEVEMRACAIHAVELMRAAAPDGVSGMDIDYLLWNRGYEPEIYERPSHRTETEWY